MTEHLHIEPWPQDFPGPGFAARSDYTETCWTWVIGPTAVLALRVLAATVDTACGAATVDRDEVALTLGVGAGTGRRGVLCRALGRLEMFGLAMLLPDGSLAVRTVVPVLRPHQLRRAPRAVQLLHHHYVDDQPADQQQAS
ncbi:MAG: hypothetical protein ACRD0U_18760 [Acidimicrobiales bacterium]